MAAGTLSDAEEDLDGAYEPAGSEPVATGRVSECASFWRSFVRSGVVMDWIENGYRLLWETAVPAAKESPNKASAMEHKEFVSGAIAEMLEAGALTLLPKGQRPTVVSPMGVVPNRGPRSSAS